MFLQSTTYAFFKRFMINGVKIKALGELKMA